jgi:hypothetical protein
MTFGGKSMNTFAKTVLVGIIAIGCGRLTFWAVHQSESQKIDRLLPGALCELELAPGAEEVSTSFTLPRAVDQLRFGLRMRAEEERLSVTVTDGDKLICRATLVKTTHFGGGRDIPAGTYTAILRQESGSQGGYIVISDRLDASGYTGWQVLSRAFVTLVFLAGIWALLARNSPSGRHRALSRQIFHTLLLPTAAIFMYLLFHEGGHAIGQLAFGRFDLARSDFWGIHGHPHSGGKSGPSLAPWKQAVITGGGPMFPTFTGWVLFLIWITPFARKLRETHSLLSLYYGTVMALALFPFIAVAST